MEIPLDRFMPKDIKGKPHMLGLFEEETDKFSSEFRTEGAKKYAYKDKKYGEIHITVSGVPKCGSKALKSLEDFTDNFVFDYKDTGKMLLIYNDDMQPFELTDYKGKKQIVKDKYGCSLIPTTYELGKALEYSQLLSDESSARSIYKE